MITEFPTQAATVVALLAFDSEGLEFDWRHEVLNKAHRSKKQAAWKHKLPLQPTGVSLENRPTAFIDTALTPSAWQSDPLGKRLRRPRQTRSHAVRVEHSSERLPSYQVERVPDKKKTSERV